MKRRLSFLLVLCLATSAIGQGSSIFPYTTPLWRTFLDGVKATFQADSDSTTFFQVLDASGNVLFTVDTSNGLVKIGDVDGSYVSIEDDGDITFIGSAGLATGEIYVNDNTTETVISGTGTANKVQVTVFNVNGVNNNVTPDHTTDDLTITTSALYQVDAKITTESVAGVAAEISFDVYKNNGATALPSIHAHRSFAAGGGTVGYVGPGGKVALTAGDTVELWVHNETNTRNVIVSDCTFGVTQIAGFTAAIATDVLLLSGGVDKLLLSDGSSFLLIRP